MRFESTDTLIAKLSFTKLSTPSETSASLLPPRQHMGNPLESLIDKCEAIGDSIDGFVTRSCGDTFAAHFRRFGPFLCRAFSVIIYYLIGIAWYKKYEHWTELDSAYFITVSVSTVGYGFLHPTTDQSRIFTCFYDIIGIFLVLDTLNYLATGALLNFQNHVVDFFSPSGSVYTRSLKRFALSMFNIFFAIFIGTLFFAVNESDWTFDMAFYWVITTITTIGYGDLGGDITDAGKKFSIFFILFVVTIYATAIANIVAALAESSRYSYV